jgi:hypothetical protein
MSKIIDAEDIRAEARAWLVRFLQGRSREETERIKTVLENAFPRPAPAAPDNAPNLARTKRRSK